MDPLNTLCCLYLSIRQTLEDHSLVVPWWCTLRRLLLLSLVLPPVPGILWSAASPGCGNIKNISFHFQKNPFEPSLADSEPFILLHLLLLFHYILCSPKYPTPLPLLQSTSQVVSVSTQDTGIRIQCMQERLPWRGTHECSPIEGSSIRIAHLQSMPTSELRELRPQYPETRRVISFH